MLAEEVTGLTTGPVGEDDCKLSTPEVGLREVGLADGGDRTVFGQTGEGDFGVGKNVFDAA